MIICSLYRHPHNNFDEFYDNFLEVLSKLDPKTPLVIAGDVNINASSQNSKSQQYKNFFIKSRT